MSEKKQYNSHRILTNVFWSLLGMGTVVLLGAAINKKQNKYCKGVEISISGVQSNFFIDKEEVNRILERMNGGILKGRSLSKFSLSEMENTLRKNLWIRTAELFFDNNEILRVNINEREPVARIFTSAGSSFYIDSTLKLLPLNYRSSARVPVFTNFQYTTNFSKADSSMLKHITTLGSYILNNDFWMAQIDQVDITPEKTFEMVPKVGNHIIAFGTAENMEEKFNNLLTFYRQVAVKTGWNKYSRINVQYKNQIVGVKRDAREVLQDSIRAKVLMQLIVVNAQKRALDSANNIQLSQPEDDFSIPPPPLDEDQTLEKKEMNLPVLPVPQKSTPTFMEKPETKRTTNTVPAKKILANQKSALSSKTIVKKAEPIKKSLSHEKPNPIPMKKPAVKPLTTKPGEKQKSKPKAVMPPQNDY